MFSIFFPPEGTFDWRLGWGWGGGDGGNKSKKITKQYKKNSLYEMCSHFWTCFRECKKTSLKYVHIYKKMTPNPINALEIIIYNTKHTKIQKFLSQSQNFILTKKQWYFQTKQNIVYQFFIILICCVYYYLIFFVYLYILSP